ncbi:hypothetical protein SARC_05676, partial [Sphaeroforma arctica JP610]
SYICRELERVCIRMLYNVHAFTTCIQYQQQQTEYKLKYGQQLAQTGPGSPEEQWPSLPGPKLLTTISQFIKMVEIAGMACRDEHQRQSIADDFTMRRVSLCMFRDLLSGSKGGPWIYLARTGYRRLRIQTSLYFGKTTCRRSLMLTKILVALKLQCVRSMPFKKRPRHFVYSRLQDSC